MTSTHQEHQKLVSVIDGAWEDRSSLSPANAPAELQAAVEDVIAQLDRGTLRVAEKMNGEWVTHQWIKKAVLLSFRLRDNAPLDCGGLRFYDKVAPKFTRYSEADFKAGGFRVVPPAVAQALRRAS